MTRGILFFYQHANLTQFLFGFSSDTRDSEGADASKKIASDILGGKLFKQVNKESADGDGTHGPIGTHSIRKLASTHSRRSGATKDEKDVRGRWKGKGRVSDVYDDVELPWPDLKVAQMLCLGGACRYELQNGVTDQFVLTHVVPSIRANLDDDISVIFGTALMYSIFCISDDTNNVPPSLRNRVRNAYKNEVEDPNKAPVRRVSVICTGNEGEIYIDDIITDAQLNQGEGNQGPGDNQVAGQGLSDRPLRDQLRAMQSQLHSVKSSIQDLEKRIEANHMSASRTLQSISANIKRFGVSPARPVTRLSSGQASVTACLSAHPRTLYELWDEYTVGIGGSKPAREFTALERGKCKYRYYRRKIAWDLIARRLQRSGLEVHVIIDRIYQHYGRECSVTDITKAIQEDKKRNYVPPILRFL